ncbi:helix-turn-helix domain-containing protein [Cellulomonas sp. KRMCY2]|uniref:helix-turn-helix domain-containing protein n=1 Tax=Cellulomonas sp. KRMCY2 TaxID=1304865 RepID=UPI0009DDF86F|nr:helix-turn-helix domain-containing protein [Cellulomonas sp. KRMCY2]
MATVLDAQSRVLASDAEVALAQEVLVSLDGPLGYLSVGHGSAGPRPLPPDLGRLLQTVLHAVASGSSITVMTTPREVTTSTAAAMLGVSRPTLMKMVKDGALPAHKVGTHTRLLSEDVLEAKKARRARERAAFAALLEAEGDEA